MKTGAEFLDWNKVTPYAGLQFYVKTSWGEIRRAILPNDNCTLGYRFTDCTHPLQNTNLPSHDIKGWRYVDKQNIGAFKFYENKYARHTN